MTATISRTGTTDGAGLLNPTASAVAPSHPANLQHKVAGLLKLSVSELSDFNLALLTTSELEALIAQTGDLVRASIIRTKLESTAVLQQSVETLRHNQPAYAYYSFAEVAEKLVQGGYTAPEIRAYGQILARIEKIKSAQQPHIISIEHYVQNPALVASADAETLAQLSQKIAEEIKRTKATLEAEKAANAFQRGENRGGFFGRVKLLFVNIGKGGSLSSAKIRQSRMQISDRYIQTLQFKTGELAALLVLVNAAQGRNINDNGRTAIEELLPASDNINYAARLKDLQVKNAQEEQFWKRQAQKRKLDRWAPPIFQMLQSFIDFWRDGATLHTYTDEIDSLKRTIASNDRIRNILNQAQKFYGAQAEQNVSIIGAGLVSTPVALGTPTLTPIYPGATFQGGKSPNAR